MESDVFTESDGRAHVSVGCVVVVDIAVVVHVIRVIAVVVIRRTQPHGKTIRKQYYAFYKFIIPKSILIQPDNKFMHYKYFSQ